MWSSALNARTSLPVARSQINTLQGAVENARGVHMCVRLSSTQGRQVQSESDAPCWGRPDKDDEMGVELSVI